ncbi:MAG: hypothetical protein R3335_01940 [Anaerolineales bacterium]|nr:hypothetical protein [Anaerolineales bacterium]
MTVQSPEAKPWTRLVALFAVSLIIAVSVVAVGGFRFLIPEELVYSAGLIRGEPQFVALSSELAVFIDRDATEITARGRFHIPAAAALAGSKEEIPVYPWREESAVEPRGC